jgi:predicted double-glycine peptidase
VLSHWGSDVDEEDLMRILATSSEVGTYPEDIVRGARSLGFEAEAKENLTLDEVERFTADGHPMIALGQFWLSEREMAASLAEEWETGHYIVVLAVDKDYVYFQDPFVRMSKAFVPRKTFEERAKGHGRKAGEEPETWHLGIFVRGQKPAEQRPQ